jgi:hypothetical protein
MSTMPQDGARKRLRLLLACYALLGWLTLAEHHVFDRLLFQQPVNYEFVLANVQGVLTGTPVSKSWQHRFLAPAGVLALEALAKSRLEALELFSGLMALAANLLLFGLMRHKGASLFQSLAAVVGFGLAHLLLTYKLEYPWDGVDILLFLAFGYWTSKRGPILALAPLLLIGMLNHETVLYMPLFYLLSLLDRASSHASKKKDALLALLFSLVLGAGIFYLRERFYLRSPNLPGSTVEPVTPLISNHLHVMHNLRQLLVADWKEGRAFISSGFLAAIALLLTLVAKRAQTTAALWSLCVMATIVCFGYINETRHYLMLVAFWFTYALPVSSKAHAQ